MQGALSKKFFSVLTKKERLCFFFFLTIFLISSISVLALVLQGKSAIEPIEGGVFREGVIGQPTSVNPILSSNPVDLDLSALLFSRLFDLLTNYDVSEDGRVYTLKLKEDLKWDDGMPLTSDDVIFTIKLIQNPENHSPFIKSWQGIAVERISELQVKATLPTPYVFFEDNVKRLSVIPKHIWEKIPTDNLSLSVNNLQPVGNGPYKFKSLKTRRDGFIIEYQLARNQYFDREVPYIPDFSFKFYGNEEELLGAFRFREINGFGKLIPLDGGTTSLGNVVVREIPMPRYYAVFFNSMANSLFKDKNLRLALNYATPIQRIVEETTGGEGQVIPGPVLRDAIGLAESPLSISYNPDEARKLLEKVKLPKDEESIDINLIVPQVKFLVRVAEILKKEWLAAGINTVDIIALNPEDLVNEIIKTRKYEAVLFGNVLENPEDLFPFWHSSQRFYPGLNLALYQNLEADKFIEAIRQTSEAEKRKPILEQLEKAILSDYPAIFLFALPYSYVHSDQLQGFEAESLVVPSDRFRNVQKWNLLRVRVLK